MIFQEGHKYGVFLNHSILYNQGLGNDDADYSGYIYNNNRIDFCNDICGANALLYREIADRKTFAQDAESMSFDIQNGNYAGLIQGKYMNEFYGETEPTGYHALGDYVEAAFFYKVYDTKGYTEKANKQKAIMDESRVKMKELTVFADKADKMFMISE